MRKGDGRREGGKKEERNGKIKGWREKWKERQKGQRERSRHGEGRQSEESQP